MWRKKKLTYEICIPPINKPVSSMNSRETKEYFDWFIEKIPERIQYLSEKIADDCKIKINLTDFTPESLVVIWRWFLDKAQTEKTDSNVLRLDMQTEYIVRDIGMFMGEFFNVRHAGIHWSYYKTPKADIFVNKPVLIGFKDNCVSPPFDAVFEPVHMVRVQATKIVLNKQNENDLLNLYNIWSEKIVKTDK